MNTSLSFRSAQPLAATSISTRGQLRAVLLGALAVLGSIGSAQAQEASSVKIKQGDAQNLLLTVENPQQQRMRMEVFSVVNHAVLVNEVNHRPSYGSTLNFNGVPAGLYTVTLRVGRERYRYNVQVANQPQTTISVRELTPAQAPTMVATTTR
jgi:hypothetical protein